MKAKDNIGELELKKKKKKIWLLRKIRKTKVCDPKPSALEIKWKNLDINVINVVE